MASDYYAELGVARTASADEIRRAYRQLAKELHPDARPDDPAAEERFKRITAAFHVLSDPERRRDYDRGGSQAASARYDPGGPGFDGGFADLDDILSGVFGGGAAARERRGADLRYRLEVEFLEAAVGARRRVVMGDGKQLEIVIPEGARTGQVLRLRGQGRPGPRGAAPGDALVELEVESHPFFQRQGDDILIDLPISLKEAVLGARIKAPTLTGPVTLTVPKGANSGVVLRLRGKGVKGAKSRGDQLVRLVVMLPERSDPALVKAIEGWDDSAHPDPRAKLKI